MNDNCVNNEPCKKVISVFVNKSWEFEPFFNALSNPKLSNEKFLNPCYVCPPEKIKGHGYPRAVYKMDKLVVYLWCIEDLMAPKQIPQYYSNSKMKYNDLITWLANTQDVPYPDFTISVSTAESTPDIIPSPEENDTINGSVIMGSRYFMFDAREYDTKTVLPSELEITEDDKYREDHLKGSLYDLINVSVNEAFKKKALIAKNAFNPNLICAANRKFTSVGVVNIVNYEGYEKGDPAAYEAFKDKFNGHPDIGKSIPVCLETTHGLLKKLYVDKKITTPILFVSPITDRYMHFNNDVNDTQNYVAAFNAGIAVLELIAAIDSYNSIPFVI